MPNKMPNDLPAILLILFLFFFSVALVATPIIFFNNLDKKGMEEHRQEIDDAMNQVDITSKIPYKRTHP